VHHHQLTIDFRYWVSFGLIPASLNNTQIPSPDKQFSEFEPITITFHEAVVGIKLGSI
jgi:hypothetical protein